METRQLGDTDVFVSALCLGTMTWGRQNTEEEAFAQMDYAFDKGINFFDTAELYPIPPEADTQGRTETMIGNWFAKTGKRRDVILATKVVGRSKMTWFRENGDEAELTKEQITEAIEKSLKRLNTDYIDLYQLHWPDRPLTLFGGLGYQHYSDEINRIEDTLGVLDGLKQAGKVRHFGLSNETPWGMMKFLHYAETKNLPRIVSVQNAYNLLNRTYELGCSEIYYRDKVGLLAYSPLAQGYLTGKYQNGEIPVGSRKYIAPRLNRYETTGSEEAVDKYLALANKYGLNPAKMAIQFVTTRPFVTSNIIGATSMEQLEIAISSIDVALNDDILSEIEGIHLSASNLCP